ncbi:hypothetical protein, partial [Staphylococcus pasteuri_A]
MHAIEQKMAAQLEDTQPAAMSNDLDSMLQMIMQQSAETVIEPSQPRLQEEISLGDKRFPLPRA